jgi:hypothetical protein
MSSELFSSARTRLYVVGDIHGRLDLLDRVILAISRDLEFQPVSECLRFLSSQ